VHERHESHDACDREGGDKYDPRHGEREPPAGVDSVLPLLRPAVRLRNEHCAEDLTRNSDNIGPRSIQIIPRNIGESWI
jgi:hypothetical protein